VIRVIWHQNLMLEVNVSNSIVLSEYIWTVPQRTNTRSVIVLSPPALSVNVLTLPIECYVI
jgi:hypothetical protein